MKTTGKEWKQFVNDQKWWPKDHWMDELVLNIDGVEVEDVEDDPIPDTASVKITYGTVYNEHNRETTSLKSFFKKWRADQTSVTFLVTVAKDKEEAVRAAIKKAGGKVLK